MIGIFSKKDVGWHNSLTWDFSEIFARKSNTYVPLQNTQKRSSKNRPLWVPYQRVILDKKIEVVGRSISPLPLWPNPQILVVCSRNKYLQDIVIEYLPFFPRHQVRIIIADDMKWRNGASDVVNIGEQCRWILCARQRLCAHSFFLSGLYTTNCLTLHVTTSYYNMKFLSIERVYAELVQ